MSNFEERLQQAIKERGEQKTLSGSIERFDAWCKKHNFRACEYKSLLAYESVRGYENG